MQSGEFILEFMRGNPVFTLFMVLGSGYLVGRIRIGSISLGPVAGALIVSLLLGQYGFKINEGAQSVGFALFIFAVGYQAGPRFFEVLRTQGLQYLLLALFVAATGGAIAIACGHLMELPFGGTAGLLAGAMTTTPTLAAAQEAVRSGLVDIPDGVTADTVLATIASSYAITYVVGLLGIIAAVRLLPRVMGIDLAAEALKMEAEEQEQPRGEMQARAYRVTRPQACEPTVKELRARLWDSLAVLRLRRDGEWIVRPGDEEHLRLGDEIHAYGDSSFFRGGIEELGEEITVSKEIDLTASSSHIVIARRDAVGKRLAELDLARGHGLVVTEVRRDGVLLPLSGHLRLQRSDVLGVVGPRSALAGLEEILGPVESGVNETDMATFAFGIAFGALVGVLAVSVKGIPIGLGMAGGLLGAGILVGWLNATRPSFGRFPEAARWILMEFGLMIFIVGIGLQAGDQIVETFLVAGPGLILASVLVVTGPLLMGYVLGRKVLRLPPLLLLGALTGAMTSAAAMSLVNREANSSIPALGYTGTYAFANVILTLAGTLIMFT
jgi:putative transport protein